MGKQICLTRENEESSEDFIAAAAKEMILLRGDVQHRPTIAQLVREAPVPCIFSLQNSGKDSLSSARLRGLRNQLVSKGPKDDVDLYMRRWSADHSS